MSANGSFWLETPLPEFAPLNRDLQVDVVIVGGGFTGITAAYMLRNEGIRVALLERGRLARADTGNTTSHLTYVTDERLHELANKYGEDAAREYWCAGAAAIDQIQDIAADTGSDCEFLRVPGYLHSASNERSPAEDEVERGKLQRDAELAHKFGFAAELVESVPYAKQLGVRFEKQAKFHPRKYLRGLLRTFSPDGRSGSYIFENTHFESVEDQPFAIRANGCRIRCDYLVMATHAPLLAMPGLFDTKPLQSKLSLYKSFVLGAKIPLSTLPQALFWDTSDPYDYLRIDTYQDHQLAIFGGDDVQISSEQAGKPYVHERSIFAQLQRRLCALLPDAVVSHQWSGEVVVSSDGFPFIGECSAREFIATGFCGNGFTLGTAAAMMIRDRFQRRENTWSDLFRIDRKPYHGGRWRYLQDHFDFQVDRNGRAHIDNATGNVSR
jgi:glycine/D-amino acid oxidase-like deaminating enzyme